MALDFSPQLGTKRVACGTGISANDATHTFWAWFLVNNITSRGDFFNRGKTDSSDAEYLSIQSGGGEIEFLRGRATTNCSYLTNSTPIASANKWYFVAEVFDTGAGANEVCNIYVGDETTDASEATYSINIDGSGALGDNSTGTFYIGNREIPAINRSFPGYIAFASYITSALTLQQVIDVQYNLLPYVGAELSMHLGLEGTGTQPDWSGNGNDGTVTGATQVEHVPLPIFPPTPSYFFMPAAADEMRQSILTPSAPQIAVPRLNI